MHRYILLGSTDTDGDFLDVLDAGEKDAMRKAFEEHLADGEYLTLLLVKTVVEAQSTYEITENDDESDV